ncbi:type I 3-dehydroquinate dehydratase [Peptostreptococcus equinus]|uniref:3-dehydroquinate dehydratase n=1 Tax=Peptostreptococcus equinus TaxID=3003601 RepID=A0ABY7JMW6_9FIRM|nr:type I 3-dehydroquinate dehydratase [Peptostreptococcus sp. CBA3647]WAW14509.1 type I 3-dehydroquinate dehydratase [Peptostreptococcus sp. CBA3647]
MKTYMVRNVEIGKDSPKICVPIVGEEIEEILESAAEIADTKADIVEWRVDYFNSYDNYEQILICLKKLRSLLRDIPIIFTFRTDKECGHKNIDRDYYTKLNKLAIESSLIDIVDIEVNTIGDDMKELIELAHKNNVLLIGSIHNFESTPTREDIMENLKYIESLNVDIPKVAYMPNCNEDVMNLLAASKDIYENYSDRPFIAISMSDIGFISRICGNRFGSAITFGTVGKNSAPGQVDIDNLIDKMALFS